MGEYADMMINGESCQYCGQYLGDAVGFPRVCEDCANASHNDFEKVTEKERLTNMEDGKDSKF